MKVYLHLIRPDGYIYPTRDWIIQECQRVASIELTVPQYNKLKREATLTEEVGSPPHYTCVIDYEETNIDEDTGLPQPAKVTFSGILY